MNYEEALAWLRGERCTVNIVPQDPHETWAARVAETDAAMMQQAYWLLKSYKEGLVP